MNFRTLSIRDTSSTQMSEKLFNEQASKLSYVGAYLLGKASNNAERRNGTSSCLRNFRKTPFLPRYNYWTIAIVHKQRENFAVWAARSLLNSQATIKRTKEGRNMKEVAPPPPRIKKISVFWPVLFLGTVRFEGSRIITESRWSPVLCRWSTHEPQRAEKRNGKLVSI